MMNWWQEQYDRFMPHIHCFDGDEFIIVNTIANDGVTVLQYAIIAVMFFYSARWGKKGGDWFKLVFSLGFVFVFCALNYLMNIIIIYEPVYYLQLLLKLLGNLFFAKAVYHLLTLDKTALILLVRAVKQTIKDGKF